MTDPAAIQNVIAAYCQLNDDRRFDEFEELWTEDATFGSSTRTPVHKGRGNIRRHFESRSDPARRGIHAPFTPRIKVNGEEAEATADYVWFGVSQGELELGPGGRYKFRFAKESGCWRISELFVQVLLTAQENEARRTRRAR